MEYYGRSLTKNPYPHWFTYLPNVTWLIQIHQKR